MKALITALSLAALHVNAAPPEADRAAILGMAGTFDVNFRFTEDAALAPGYKIVSKPYEEHALEVVIVVEDSPERIILQHLLVVTNVEKKTDFVIKHWAQVWTWEDTEMLRYSGEDGIDEWQRVSIPAENAAGTWSQFVTSVDDTPRYEGQGKWRHELGISTWSGADTARPLPRREYTKRDDYDLLLGTNTHTIGANGWLHFQDNFKVITRDGKPTALAHETGLNQYVRIDSPRAAVAIEWWAKHGKAWDGIREFWLTAVDDSEKSFAYTTTRDGTGLTKALTALSAGKPSATEISKVLNPYLISNN